MNLSDKILQLLLEPKFKYKGVPINIFFLPAFGNYKKQSVKNSLSELKKHGHVIAGEDKVIISKIGKNFIERKLDSMKQFSSCFPEDAPKKLIVMYDIPEEKKAEREWFRFHLRKFDYEMIHKSVWVGPSPLPTEFVAYIKKINLEGNIKVLRLAKSYEPNTFHL